MAGWWFLALALLGTLLVVNAASPRHGPLLLLPSWVLAFLTTDLAPFHLALQGLVTVGFVLAGALDTAQGKVALALSAASALGLLRLWMPNLGAAAVAEAVAADLQLDESPPVPRRLLLTPFRRTRDGVVVSRDIEFSRAAGRILKLDVYAPEHRAAARPAVIYLHGGGWVTGDKKSQGLPLCNHLAASGWLCCNANYRLSPAATYPDQVIDAKAAIAWLREHAAEYGVDPSFIALAGCSAGAHIAAMAALTPDDPGLQPGLEDRDTSIQAVVTLYGIYDLTNRRGAHNAEFVTNMIGPLVIKAFPDADAKRFHDASPRDNAHRVQQPWLVIQGAADTLTPAVEARDFVATLREHAQHAVGYAEFPGAQHGLDIYYSPRAAAAIELAARFLQTTCGRARATPTGAT